MYITAEMLDNAYKNCLAFAEHATRLEWIGDYIFDFTTYDSSMTEHLARIMLDVCIAITERKTFEYIDKSHTHYANYIIMCNLPFLQGKLDWGASIRGAWWGGYNYDGKTGKTDCRIPFKAHELFDGEQRFTREEWEEFIRTLAAWIEVE